MKNSGEKSKVYKEIVTLWYIKKSEENYFAKCLFALLADN